MFKSKRVLDNSVSLKGFKLLHLFVYMESDEHSCVDSKKWQALEKFKHNISHIHTRDPLLSGQVCGVGVLAELLVSESYTNAECSLPSPKGGSPRGVKCCLTIRQGLCLSV